MNIHAIQSFIFAHSFRAVAVSALLLSGCAQYQLTFNETVVREAKTLFTDFTTADRNLRNCIDQHIKDKNISSANQLTSLSCTHAGIKTLQGLAMFRNLTHINLSHNQLTSISELTKLGKIKVLQLNNNDLHAVPELLTLPALEELNVLENPNLRCEDLNQLQNIFQGNMTAAQHCKPT